MFNGTGNPVDPMDIIRDIRDQLLKESDFMGNSDYPMSNAWRAYRQVLRDITSSASPQYVEGTRELVKNSDTHKSVAGITWPDPPDDTLKKPQYPLHTDHVNNLV